MYLVIGTLSDPGGIPYTPRAFRVEYGWSWSMMRHVSCIILLECSTTSRKLDVYDVCPPVYNKNTGSHSKRACWLPREFSSQQQMGVHYPRPVWKNRYALNNRVGVGGGGVGGGHYLFEGRHRKTTALAFRRCCPPFSFLSATTRRPPPPFFFSFGGGGGRGGHRLPIDKVFVSVYARTEGEEAHYVG